MSEMLSSSRGSGSSWLPLAGGTMSGPLLVGGTGFIELTAPVTATGGTQTAIHGNYTYNGTVVSGHYGYWPLGVFIQATSNIAAPGSNTAIILANAFTGPGTLGGVTSIVGQVAINTTTANTLTSDEYTSLRAISSATVPANIAGSGYRGNLYGATITSGLQEGAAGYYILCASEFAVQAVAGSSVYNKSGIYLLQYPADAVQGSGYDIGFGAWRYSISNTGIGWSVLFGIGNGQNYQPVAEDGTVMKFWPGSGDNITIANVFDFSQATVTGHYLNFANFHVTGSGSMGVGENMVVGSGFANSIYMQGATTTNRPFVLFTGSGPVVGGEFQTKGLGSFNFTANAGALMDFVIESAAGSISYPSFTPSAASANILFDVGGTATGITIGGSTATGVTIGKNGVTLTAPGGITSPQIDNGPAGVTVAAAASRLAFFGGPAAAKPTVTGSKGSNPALSSLMTALGASGLGLVTDSTS